MDKGGGSLFLKGNDNYTGVGHNGVYTHENTNYTIFHAYDMKDEGKPKLKIAVMEWDEDLWPKLNTNILK